MFWIFLAPPNTPPHLYKVHKKCPRSAQIQSLDHTTLWAQMGGTEVVPHCHCLLGTPSSANGIYCSSQVSMCHLEGTLGEKTIKKCENLKNQWFEDLSVAEITQNYYKTTPKSPQNHLKITSKSPQNHFKTTPKSLQSHSKSLQKTFKLTPNLLKGLELTNGIDLGASEMSWMSHGWYYRVLT